MNLNPNPNPPRTRKPDPNKSPEFEFPHCSTLSPPSLHSADQIFSHGFLIPLYHLLPDPSSKPDPEPSPPSILSTNPNPILSASKRWKEIFTLGEKKSKSKPKSTSTDKTKANIYNGKNIFTAKENSSTLSGAELNINIWPFTRSRSAGNNTNRTRPVTNRKVSSAPCSRSNSSGESKMMRKSPWPNSPGRTGVHLGRSSPVWQIKKNRSGSEESRKGKRFGSSVNTCKVYRQDLSCRSNEIPPCHGGQSGGGGGGSGSGNLFGLRGLFSKKGVLSV